MKKSKLFLAIMTGALVISGCSAKTDQKKEEN